MWVGYQTAEDQHQTRIWVEDKHSAKVRAESAFHMSIYQLQKYPGSGDVEDQLYSGDLWFDIDHKPSVENPTQEDVKKALHQSIIDARRLVSYFEAVNVDPKYLSLFATGGKGFHIRVPGILYSHTGKSKSLPKIHKCLAITIRDRAQITGLDLQIYSMGQGQLLRVENKQRANGQYKVPITIDELKVMTPEMYHSITSSPRTVPVTEPIAPIPALVEIFSEAERLFEQVTDVAYKSVPNELLNVFSDGEHPVCVQQIISNQNVKQEEGMFNRAKMSLARYLVHAPITNTERDNLLDTFAENWTSKTFRTAYDRKKAVKSVFDWVQETGFSCAAICSSMVENPCSGCPLREEQERAAAEKTPILQSEFGYSRMTAKGEPLSLSNFVLKPRIRYQDAYDDSTTYLAYDFQVIKDKVVHSEVHLDNKAWTSNRQFKDQIMHISGLRWVGNDVDLSYLGSLLTNHAPGEITVMKYVRAVGIHRQADPSDGSDVYVWVEDESSTMGAIDGILKYHGPQGTEGEKIALPLTNITPLSGEDADENATLEALMSSNVDEVMGPVIGWMMGCWLRSHWRSGEDTDKHLPALQIYGSSGHGKTETATLFSMLAGSDYKSTEPLVVSASTPHAIKTEAALSTTVPRIFDEMNQHKISEQSRYSAAREAVKTSARGGSQKSGVVTDKGVGIDSKPATAPIIMLATQLNPENEIQERTVPVSIKKERRKPQHTKAFARTRQHPAHIRSFAARAMRVTLRLSSDWVTDAIKRNSERLPEDYRYDRVGRNWLFVLVGLDYLKYVMQEQEIDMRGTKHVLSAMPAHLLDRADQLKNFMLTWLEEHKRELTQSTIAQEIDKIIDVFGEMVIENSGWGGGRFKHGEHYVVQGDTLYVWSASFFPQYVRYCRVTLMVPPELTSIKQYNELMNGQEYCLGVGGPVGCKGSSGWHTLSIPLLKDRGVRVENFLAD